MSLEGGCGGVYVDGDEGVKWKMNGRVEGILDELLVAYLVFQKEELGAGMLGRVALDR